MGYNNWVTITQKTYIIGIQNSISLKNGGCFMLGTIGRLGLGIFALTGSIQGGIASQPVNPETSHRQSTGSGVVRYSSNPEGAVNPFMQENLHTESPALLDELQFIESQMIASEKLIDQYKTPEEKSAELERNERSIDLPSLDYLNTDFVACMFANGFGCLVAYPNTRHLLSRILEKLVRNDDRVRGFANDIQTELSGAIDDLGDDVDSLESDFDSLETKVSGAESKVEVFEQDLVDVQTNIENSMNRLTSLDSIVSVLQRSVESVDRTHLNLYDDLSGIVAGLSESFRVLNESYATLNESYAMIGNRVNQIDERLFSIENIIDELSTEEPITGAQQQATNTAASTSHRSSSKNSDTAQNIIIAVLSILSVSALMLSVVNTVRAERKKHKDEGLYIPEEPSPRIQIINNTPGEYMKKKESTTALIKSNYTPAEYPTDYSCEYSGDYSTKV